MGIKSMEGILNTVTRREFLKGSTLAGFGLAVSPMVEGNSWKLMAEELSTKHGRREAKVITTEIEEDIFRINFAIPDMPVTFSLFLIKDESPILIATSFNRLFEEVKAQLLRVLDPSTIRYIVIPHFEGDECGSLPKFLVLTPDVKLIASPIGARGSVSDFAGRDVMPVEDNQFIKLGKHRLRFILTPQVHQWDSLMAYEETKKVLFSSDLFIQPGDRKPIIEEDLSELMVDAYRKSGVMPSMGHIHLALDKLAKLDIRLIACHHGSVIAGNTDKYIKALRESDVTSLANHKRVGRT